MPARSCNFKIFCHAQNPYGSARNSVVISRETDYCNKSLKSKNSDSKFVLSKPTSKGLTGYLQMAQPYKAFENIRKSVDEYCYDNDSEPKLKPAALKECCGKSSGSTLYKMIPSNKKIHLINFIYYIVSCFSFYLSLNYFHL